MEADHGAIFETSVLAQIRPELVKLENLPDKKSKPANDPQGNSHGVHRGEATNVLFGILGNDPRDYCENTAKEITDKIIDWVVRQTVT